MRSRMKLPGVAAAAVAGVSLVLMRGRTYTKRPSDALRLGARVVGSGGSRGVRFERSEVEGAAAEVADDHGDVRAVADGGAQGRRERALGVRRRALGRHL